MCVRLVLEKPRDGFGGPLPVGNAVGDTHATKTVPGQLESRETSKTGFDRSQPVSVTHLDLRRTLFPTVNSSETMAPEWSQDAGQLAASQTDEIGVRKLEYLGIPGASEEDAQEHMRIWCAVGELGGHEGCREDASPGGPRYYEP